jgi:ABC-type sugar transport system permease subunit
VLSFTSWDGIGGVSTIEWVGTRNYQQTFEIYPPFWPALRHNVIWLVFLTLVPTVLGLLLAYLLDRKIRGTRVYQSIFSCRCCSLAVARAAAPLSRPCVSAQPAASRSARRSKKRDHP